jgi:NAD(P)-dependent dehydrogenase (short-subunit alcohol dehydrogenase family)
MPEPGRLRGRVAIVTGAQQGIGAAIARSLAGEGSAVVVNHLDDQSAADRIVSEVEDAGGRAVAVGADVSSMEGVDALIEAAASLGGVDLLVNNAGVFPRSGFLDMTRAEWDSVLAVNLTGAFLCSQAVARDMVARSAPGAIVNISSTVALIGSRQGVHYTASKSGLLGLTRSTALALAEHDIRVNAIAVGMTDTAQPRAGLTEEQIGAIVSGFPLGRLIRPEEIAVAAVFLLSDDSSSVTGQTLHVNGGALMP